MYYYDSNFRLCYRDNEKILNLINTNLIIFFKGLQRDLLKYDLGFESKNISNYYLQKIAEDKTQLPKSISDFRNVSQSGTSGKSGAIIKMIKGDIYSLKENTKEDIPFNGKKLPSDCQNGIEVSLHCNSSQLRSRSFILQKNNNIIWKKIGNTEILRSMNVKFINFKDNEEEIIFINNSSNQKLYVKPNNYDKTKKELMSKLESTYYNNYVLKTWNVVLPKNKLIIQQSTTDQNTQCYQLHPCLMELMASNMIMNIVDQNYKQFQAQDFALPVMFDYKFQKNGSNTQVEIYILMEKAQFEGFFNFKNYILEKKMIDKKKIFYMIKKYLDNFQTMYDSFSFVHTDLKLDNIFIGTDNEGKEILKISDLDKACFSFKNETEGTFQFVPLNGGSSSGNDNKSSRKCVIKSQELITDCKYLFTDLFLRLCQRSIKYKEQINFGSILATFNKAFELILQKIDNKLTIKSILEKLQDSRRNLALYNLIPTTHIDFMSFNITKSVQIIFGN